MSRLHVTNEYVLELNNVYHAGQVSFACKISDKNPKDLHVISQSLIPCVRSSTDGGHDVPGETGG